MWLVFVGPQLSFLFFTLTADQGRKLADYWEAQGLNFSIQLFGNSTYSEDLYRNVLSLLQGFTGI